MTLSDRAGSVVRTWTHASASNCSSLSHLSAPLRAMPKAGLPTTSYRAWPTLPSVLPQRPQLPDAAPTPPMMRSVARN